ncbi:hypothetical protein HAX54_037090 [Datura stramonium]|uniref:Uncharacterized protein n=1 Tax=Datura stramonium TaxID=4076 RepID=A0ABS8SGQ4_DATST|nr:hypothetical protein [Datura stramonium]
MEKDVVYLSFQVVESVSSKRPCEDFETPRRKRAARPCEDFETDKYENTWDLTPDSDLLKELPGLAKGPVKILKCRGRKKLARPCEDFETDKYEDNSLQAVRSNHTSQRRLIRSSKRPCEDFENAEKKKPARPCEDFETDKYENTWDLTPDSDLLKELPGEYTFVTALADLIDNSLQAMRSNHTSQRRLIRSSKRPCRRFLKCRERNQLGF